jgi:hypothetical protein
MTDIGSHCSADEFATGVAMLVAWVTLRSQYLMTSAGNIIIHGPVNIEYRGNIVAYFLPTSSVGLRLF